MADLFAKLGKVISSAGSERFTSNMHELLVESVPLGLTRITEWTVNELAGKVVDVCLLGAFGAQRDVARTTMPAGHVSRDTVEHPLSKKILAAYDTQLIHMNVPPLNAGGGETTLSYRCESGFQCHLVSRKSNRRYVISLHRKPMHHDFSLREMSFLKNFADTLLPLVEWHASNCRHPARDGEDCPSERTVEASGLETLRCEFERRLKDASVALSNREVEVCLGLLAGRTVREMAGALGVKNSSIETYIKRAAVKLGFGGRHGLVKWMIDDCHSHIPAA